MEIAGEHPALSDEIARHQNVYPALLEWLNEHGTGGGREHHRATDVAAELDDPETTAARLMEIAADHPTLSSSIARHPNAYPALLEWLELHGGPAVTVQQSVPAVAPQQSVSSVAATGETASEFDLTDALISGAAAAVSTFDNFAMLEHVAEASRKVRSTLTGLLGAGDEIELAAPVVLAGAERRDALAIFTRDRLIVAWGGMLSAKGHQVIPYSSVTAAQVGPGPNELAEHATLYVNHGDQLILAMPTDDIDQIEFLALVMRGSTFDEVAPWNTASNQPPGVAPDDPLLAELASEDISAARLAELARTNPELHVAIAGHPVAYPELLDWLDSRPESATQQAVAARRQADRPVVMNREHAAVAPLGAGRSGWETADRAFDTADKVGNAFAAIMAVLYGIFLIIVGIAIAGLGFSQGNGAGLVGVGIAIYGAYVAIPLPGYKLIIW